jgi:hypothetical protein
MVTDPVAKKGGPGNSNLLLIVNVPVISVPP